MNTEIYIARKVFSQKGGKKGIATKIVSIAVASISLGLAVMIVSVAVLLGFKKEVREKVIGFGAHYQMVNYDSNNSFETAPIQIDSSVIKDILSVEGVTHLQNFATKPGIIKTGTEIHGMVLKGVDEYFNWDFFSENLTAGKLPGISTNEKSDEILISEKVARLLMLSTGDRVFCYFYNEGQVTPRSRRYTISGIYKTSLGEFDELFVFGDIKEVQSLYRWNSDKVSGYEIYINDFERLASIKNELRQITLMHANDNSLMRVNSIVEKYPMMFDWLSVLDMNVWVLLILMIAVAGINMISGLLIVIIERTRMIGILKAVGYSNFNLRKVFLYLSAFLSLRGLIWGNLIGLGICVVQYFTGIIKLDPATYYIDTVPIIFNFFFIVLLNIGTLVSIVAMIVLPSLFISRISPVEAISFE